MRRIAEVKIEAVMEGLIKIKIGDDADHKGCRHRATTIRHDLTEV